MAIEQAPWMIGRCVDHRLVGLRFAANQQAKANYDIMLQDSSEKTFSNLQKFFAESHCCSMVFLKNLKDQLIRARAISTMSQVPVEFEQQSINRELANIHDIVFRAVSSMDLMSV